ncbi:sulfatase family protein [Allorhodopirellula solitaria]|uniref:Arylsulfatase n=1 Tax=Allorhodopirellula solitaria TaxID=2527987 RepID=A0A5C5YDP7_9BACT|nr:sulfatase [Allorhodopirellula solitaria]TWT73224.1 Arylsulfatase [Allorhodopirellula solitaria]
MRLLVPLILAAVSLSVGLPHAVAERPNVVFILSDDHRFDFMSCVESCPEFLQTPNLDRMAKEGARFRNAFVSTSLCSPSRASILTGRYMHHHGVVDNQRPIPEGTQFFPQHLQDAGYTTAFIGKWHMGHDDDGPRPGFDFWASFQGQGQYFDPTLNINGTRQNFNGYTTDVLTDVALDWLQQDRSEEDPFLMYLSYKAVHYPFQPSPRNSQLYQDETIDYPETMANTHRNYRTQPQWVLDRRYSIHGIDHMETGAFDKDPVPDFDELFHNYCETVHGLDENIGRVLQALDEAGEMKNTIVIYMGDNGFHLGEHGFYDKRDAFETSIRVPMLALAPGRIAAGTQIDQLVQNIDIAPTVLDLCGLEATEEMKFDGRSMQPLWRDAASDPPEWRDHILYEYHWEWNFPATPTTLAIRTDRYKYVYYHGDWDRDSFYDLQTDPIERHNLIDVPAYQDQIESLRNQMFEELAASGGLNLPIRIPAGERLDQRKRR